MANIQGVFAREILDGRGWPTIECTVWSDSGHVTAASAGNLLQRVPELAQQTTDANPEYMHGAGVSSAVTAINTTIGQQLLGQDLTDQESVDAILKQHLLEKTIGARSAVAISKAVCKLAAQSYDMALYAYLQNKYQLTAEYFIPNSIATLASGGQRGIDNLDFANFSILPASHIPFTQEVNVVSSLFYLFEQVLISKNAIYASGIDGGYVPNLYSNSDVFELLIETIKTSRFTFAQDVFFGLDADAFYFNEKNKYRLKDKADPYSVADLINYYKKIRQLYHVTYIEDPFLEKDEAGWQKLTAELGSTTVIASNQLMAGKAELIAQLAPKKLCNAVVLHPIQQGTITDCLSAIATAREHSLSVIVGSLPVETNDDFIADFAVGVGSEYMQLGAPNRGERLSKYNRLLQINQELEFNQ